MARKHNVNVEALVVFLFGLVTILLFGNVGVLAQVEGTSSPRLRNTANKADQDLKSIARVNPSTLAMEMSLPLMTYPGRNGNSLPVGFSYSSKVWRMQAREPWWQMVNTHRVYITDILPQFSEKKAAGWTSNLVPPTIEEQTQVYDETGQPYRIPLDVPRLNDFWTYVLQEFVTANNMQAPACSRCDWIGADNVCYRWIFGFEYCPGGSPWGGGGGAGGGGGGGNQLPTYLQLYYVRKMQVSMPDGATHEFRAADGQIHCGTTATTPNPCIIPAAGNATYLSVDGSGMKLVRDDNGFTLFMPDGGRYLFPGTTISATTFIDPDGNKLAFSSVTTSGVTTNKWTDSMGRDIVDPLPHSNVGLPQGVREFSLPGLGTQTQNYEMTWRFLKPVGCETSSDPGCGDGNGALEDQTQRLYHDAKYHCQGNISINLVTQSNGEVLFPIQDNGIRPCNGFNVQRDANNNIILDSQGNPIPYATRFNPKVLTEVELPNNKKYQFRYNRYGEITKVTYPTGSYETFVYDKITPLSGGDNVAYDQTNRGVIERRVYNSAGTLEQRWTYSAGVSSYNNLYKVTITAPKENDPLGNGARTEKYLFSNGAAGYNFGFDSPLGGMPAEERTYAESDYVNARSRTVNEWTVAPARTGGTATRDPRVTRSVSMTIENGQALAVLSETEYETPGVGGSTAPTDPEHFAHLNVRRAKSHHFRNIPLSVAQTGTLEQIASYFNSSTVATVGETDYLYDASYKARGIGSLPIETRTVNPADGTVLAKAQTKYDNQVPNVSTGYPSEYTLQTYGISGSYDCGMVAPNTCWVDPATPYRGNPTTSRLWDKDNNTWIETHTRYDIFGNAVAGRNPVGAETLTTFENTTERPYKYAYPTRVDTPAPDPTNTHGSNLGSFATTTYDFMTGLPLTATDEFGQTTKTEYNDALLRPTRVFALNFTAPETQTIYDDNALTVKVRKQIDATNWDEATTFMDSLGRAVKTQAKDSQGDVFVETKYDFLGRVSMVSNPYRVGDPGGILWSLTEYDELGRVKQTREPVANQNPANPTGNVLGVTVYDISTVPEFTGTVVTTTDAGGKKGRSFTNALGQLIRVDEPDHAGNVGALPQSTPNPLPTPSPTPFEPPPSCTVGCLTGTEYPSYSTIYQYDPLGKMVAVSQGVQRRYFKYDSLGRLIRVKQPEQEVNTSLNLPDTYNTTGQWTAGFAYDVLGNVVRATDANGVSIVNDYDRAGRVKRRCYTKPNVSTTATTCAQIPAGDVSTDTPEVSFHYDGKGLSAPQTPNFAKGKLTKVTSSVSETSYKLFDNFGRLTEMEQRTPLDGQTVAQATPYVSSYVYNLSGALVEETYPSGRKVRNEFESDGDLLKVASRKAGTDVFRPFVSNFSYTASGGVSRMRLGNGRWETAKFNTRLQITELGLGASLAEPNFWKVSYEYGELQTNGDVDAAKNTGNIARQTLTVPGTSFVQSYKYDSLYRLTEAVEKTGTTRNWIQNWTYDRYGNRLTFAQNVAGAATNTTPTVDPNTNRFVTAGTNVRYDKNGNLTTDAEDRDFVFNGDNKQTAVRDALNNVIGQYFYDGEGKRVKKVTNAETTVFVYSLGKLVAEYSTDISENPQTKYLTEDHLGTPRIISNQLGQIITRRDFMPFGEELSFNVGSRSTIPSYGPNDADDIKKKFTGYLEDPETNLEYAINRYFSSGSGRFTQVDPYNIVIEKEKGENKQEKERILKEYLLKPQIWNKFLYCVNNPLTFTDKDGRDIRVTSKDGKLLFTLDDGKKEITTLTAKELYDKGIQWFEPEANNYMKLKSVAPDLKNSDSAKHFTWDKIAEFAGVDRYSSSFRSGGTGDWKAASDGAAGYFLVTVDGQPYWADAIGQIPFAVDTYRSNLESNGNPRAAVEKTLATAQNHAGGSIIPGQQVDKTNNYDNYMVLRGAIWASERYKTSGDRTWLRYHTVKETTFSPKYLADTISNGNARSYGLKR